MDEMIETVLKSIIDGVRSLIPPEDGVNAYELVEAREWGVALELLCTQLFEYDAVVPLDIREEIAAVGGLMGLDESNWTDLAVDAKVFSPS